MKHSPLLLLFLLLAAPAFASAAPVAVPAAALHFDRMLLGNVARVLSARFKTAVTITANADAPISGDFSSLDLPQALREAARQANLVVQPSGPGGQAGYTLGLPPPAPAPGPAPAQADLASAQQRRERLLQQRAVLLDQAAHLDH
jgi:hypothetical protein